MTIKPIYNFLIFCVVLFILPLNTWAQQDKGKISGTITDEQGAIVPGATISFTQKSISGNQATAQTRTSNNEGEFNIENLESGIYNISVDFYGGMSYENENVSVLANQTTKLNIQLCVGGCEQDSGNKLTKITDADKADIVNQTLEDALVNKSIADYGMLVEQKGEIILSSENISPDWIKSLPNIKLKLMTKSQIQSKADYNRDFLYLSFTKFKQTKKGVIVTLTNGWAVGKHSGMGYLSGGGSIYLYTKESGKWVGKSLGGWIS